VQLVAKERGEGDRESTARGILGLKATAKYLGIPIIGLSQLGRIAEQGQAEGDDPLDSWLASTSVIERTADAIFYLLGKRGSQAIMPRKLRITKERNRGSAGVEVQMDLHQSIFQFVPKGVKGRVVDIGEVF
jgi:replicative DNA helicase